MQLAPYLCLNRKGVQGQGQDQGQGRMPGLGSALGSASTLTATGTHPELCSHTPDDNVNGLLR